MITSLACIRHIGEHKRLTILMPARNPTRTEQLVARHTHRKCDAIIADTFKAFRAAADGWGTLSLDELIAIATTLFIKIAVEPAEKMSTNPKEMRRQLGWALVRLIKQPGDDVVN
jgi:hypothetical protein